MNPVPCVYGPDEQIPICSRPVRPKPVRPVVTKVEKEGILHLSSMAVAYMTVLTPITNVQLRHSWLQPVGGGREFLTGVSIYIVLYDFSISAVLLIVSL